MIVLHSSEAYTPIYQPFQSPSGISSPPLFPTHHRTQQLPCSVLCKHKNGQVARDLLLRGFQHHCFYHRTNQLTLNLLQLCTAQGLAFSSCQHQTILCISGHLSNNITRTLSFQCSAVLDDIFDRQINTPYTLCPAMFCLSNTLSEGQ